MKSEEQKISKFLSLVLRHKPEILGLTLDPAGWVSVSELLSAAANHGTIISNEQLHAIVANNDKKRFAFSEDRCEIRANQGHSVDVELGYKPAVPPEILYHGTAEKSVSSIKKEGLKKCARHHVHLTESIAVASAVGARYGKLVLLKIQAQKMHDDGHLFFLSLNKVWLTDNVPSQYLDFPES